MYDRIICFINCHFAAHIEAVTRRNADFDHVYRTMTFSKPSNSSNAITGMLLLACSIACLVYLSWLVYKNRLPLILSVAAGATPAVQMLRGANVCMQISYWYHIHCDYGVSIY